MQLLRISEVWFNYITYSTSDRHTRRVWKYLVSILKLRERLFLGVMRRSRITPKNSLSHNFSIDTKYFQIRRVWRSAVE